MDTYNKHITRCFSDGLACSGERWTLITSTLRDASVMGKPAIRTGDDDVRAWARRVGQGFSRTARLRYVYRAITR